MANDYIVVKFDDGIRGVKTEQCLKVLLQVSVHELHIYIPKKMVLVFPWHTMKKYLSLLMIMLFNDFLLQNYKI